MDYNKYKTDGWGLSKEALIDISAIVADFNRYAVRVVEFGSGKSTEFLHDLNQKMNLEILVTSFDNDYLYAYKPKSSDNVKLHMRPLVECSDEVFEEIFESKIIGNKMGPKTSDLSTRQRNNFYHIESGDLEGAYDLVILDGPNGNGRSLAFVHLLGYIGKGTYVLIDDHTHHDFVDRFLSIYDAELYKTNEHYVIYKIK